MFSGTSREQTTSQARHQVYYPRQVREDVDDIQLGDVLLFQEQDRPEHSASDVRQDIEHLRQSESVHVDHAECY